MAFGFVAGILFVVLLACRYGASRLRGFSDKYEILISCREPAREIQIAKRLFGALNTSGLRVFWDRNRVPLVGSAIGRCEIIIPLIGVEYVSSAECVLELYEIVRSERPELLMVPILCGGDALLHEIAQIRDPELRQAVLQAVGSPERVMMPSLDLDPFHREYTIRRIVQKVLRLLKDPPRKGIGKWIHAMYKLRC